MGRSEIIIFQHVEWEKPGRIAYAFEDSGLGYSVLNISKEKKADLPDIGGIAGIVIMGGPMGARDFDAYPGLRDEAKLARDAVSAGIPVLGVCLGHQIIATALGAKLKPAGAAELGFAPVDRVSRDEWLPLGKKPVSVLHWHSDTVGCPDGGTVIASTKKTKNQAFRCGSALGLQFHLEVDTMLFEEWLNTKKMTEGLKKSQISRMKDDFEKESPALQVLADAVFSGFAARCTSFARDHE